MRQVADIRVRHDMLLQLVVIQGAGSVSKRTGIFKASSRSRPPRPARVLFGSAAGRPCIGRVHTRSDVTAVNEERKLSAMKARLVEEAAGKLADQVVAKVRGLAVAAREKRGAIAAGGR